MTIKIFLIIATVLGFTNAFSIHPARCVKNAVKSPAMNSPLFRSKPVFSTEEGEFENDDVAVSESALVVDLEAVKTSISQNWGFILLDGAFSVAAGSTALSLPFFATDLSVISVICTLYAVGFFNLLSTFYVEEGYKAQSFLLGIAQIALGTIVQIDPWDSKLFATLAIAGSVFSEGLYRIVLASKNREMDGFWATLLSGVMSVLVSASAVKFLPIAAEWVPGFTLGIGLVGVGFSRILLSLQGRDYALAQMGYI